MLEEDDTDTEAGFDAGEYHEPEEFGGGRLDNTEEEEELETGSTCWKDVG